MQICSLMFSLLLFQLSKTFKIPRSFVDGLIDQDPEPKYVPTKRLNRLNDPWLINCSARRLIGQFTWYRRTEPYRNCRSCKSIIPMIRWIRRAACRFAVFPLWTWFQLTGTVNRSRRSATAVARTIAASLIHTGPPPIAATATVIRRRPGKTTRWLASTARMDPSPPRPRSLDNSRTGTRATAAWSTSPWRRTPAKNPRKISRATTRKRIATRGPGTGRTSRDSRHLQTGPSGEDYQRNISHFVPFRRCIRSHFFFFFFYFFFFFFFFTIDTGRANYASIRLTVNVVRSVRFS